MCRFLVGWFLVLDFVGFIVFNIHKYLVSSAGCKEQFRQELLEDKSHKIEGSQIQKGAFVIIYTNCFVCSSIKP